MPDPMWQWCPMPGASRETKLNVDVNPYGDGYVHRSTRGLNPARPSWTVQVPFTSAQQLASMDGFLRSYSAGGFWFEPPDMGGDVVFVTCDGWSSQVASRHGSHTPADIAGTLSAMFEQSFNPQPINPFALAGGQQNIVAPTLNAVAGSPPPTTVAAAPAPPIVDGGVMQPSPTTPWPDVPVQPPRIEP